MPFMVPAENLGTRQSIRVPIEIIGILCRSALGPIQRCVCRVLVLLFLHPRLCDDLFAIGCDHFSFLLK